MKKKACKILFLLLITVFTSYSQKKEIDKLAEGELKMTFPSVYFKNNSTEYAEMPQKADSILRFLAAHKKEIKSYVIWRDSTETEELTKKRIEKLKRSLAAYKSGGINIQSMGNAQKISRYTINKAEDFGQNQYLLSLNSVFEVARTRLPNKTTKKKHRSFSLPCWMNPNLDRSGRQHCKEEKRILRNQKEKKHLPRLVWCGWKYGFHWDTPGNAKKINPDTKVEDNSSNNNHINHPRIWCIKCWKKHRFSKDYRRLHVKNQPSQEKRSLN